MDAVEYDTRKHEAEVEETEDRSERFGELRDEIAKDLQQRGMAGLTSPERDLVTAGDNDLILLIADMGEACIGKDTAEVARLRQAWIERAAGMIAEKRMDAASRRLA